MAKKTSTNQKLELKAEPRTVTGKKVKQMRKQGIVPGNVFGTNFKSVSISLPFKEFEHIHKQAGETGIVYVQLEKESIPTLISQIQIHPVTQMILHVDFRKIDLKKKIETAVPVETTGTSEAVSQLGGVLLVQSDHLTVEALPQDIPAHINIDISGIKEIGQEIKVKDLPQSSTYIFKDDPEKVVVSVVAHKEESTEVQAASTEGPEILTAKPEAEGEEGATPTTEPAKAAEKTEKK